MCKWLITLAALLALSLPRVSRAQAIPGTLVPIFSTAAEASHILKTSYGTLYTLYVTTTASGYLMVFNQTTVPSSGSVTPVECIQVNTGTTSLFFGDAPAEPYSTGIVVTFSSTGCFTYTPSSTAFFHALVF